MTEAFDPRKSTTAFDQASSLVVVLELSGKSWRAGAIVPGVERRPSRQLEARDIGGALRAIEQWKSEASKAGRAVRRVVVGYEAGLDGFWIARALGACGVEVYVMHPTSLPVERRGRRAKTDRIDVDILLRALLGRLRGEPRPCTMAPIPSEAEEDMREPGRRREALTAARLKVENQMSSLLSRANGAKEPRCDVTGRGGRGADWLKGILQILMCHRFPVFLQIFMCHRFPAVRPQVRQAPGPGHT